MIGLLIFYKCINDMILRTIGMGCDSVMELASKSRRDPSSARAGALRTERRRKTGLLRSG